MQPYKELIFTIRFWYVLAYCLLVVGLQFHCTMTVLYAPLRFSLSDIVSISLILLCCHYYFKKKEAFQNILVDSNVFAWFIVFTLWMSFALWWGCYNSGALEPWALINKFLGWFILVSYFFMGNFFSKHLSEFYPILLRTLFIMSWLISGYFLVGAWLVNNFSYLLPGIELNRFVGFLENPSAYGLFCASVLLLQLPFLQKNKLFNNSTHLMGVVLGFTSVIHSGSRTAIIALICGLLFLVTKIKFKKRDCLYTIIYVSLVVIFLQVNIFNIFNNIRVDVLNLVSKYQTFIPKPLQTPISDNQSKLISSSEPIASKSISIAPIAKKPVIDGKYDYIYHSCLWLGKDSRW